MSTSSASRAAVPQPNTATVPTLAGLDKMVAADATIPRTRRRDVASALRTFSRAIGKPLEQIPAHPAYIREQVKGFVPKMSGITPGTWSNVKSLLRFTLNYAGLASVPGRYRVPLLPEWAALSERLPNPQMRYGLSRLFHYCSVKGIEPTMVNEGILDAFLEDLLTSGLINKPRSVHQMACKLWNEAATEISIWPRIKLVVPDYRDYYSLPWSTFPASLKIDVDAYCSRLSGHDLLADADIPILRPSTLATHVHELHAIASALVHQSYDARELRSLADLVAVDKVKAALRFVQQRLNAQGAAPLDGAKGRMHKLTRTITAVARYWVEVDATHLDELKDLGRRLKVKQSGMTKKNRTRLHQFDDPSRVKALIDLPGKLLQAASAASVVSQGVALTVQTAVAIEILLMLPIRLGNLSNLVVGKGLIRSRDGIWRIVIAAEDVKNSVEIDANLPAPTGKLIDIYLKKYLPKLSQGQNHWLFPGQGGKSAKSNCMLRTQISKTVLHACGIVMNPHLFRHFAAKIYLEANPGGYGVIRLVHGHKSVDTTTRFYCGTEAAAACKHFDNHILNLRADPLPSTTRRRRSAL